MVSQKKEFKEQLNCEIEYIDTHTATVHLLEDLGNIKHEEQYISIYGGNEESFNGLFKIIDTNKKEIRIQSLIKQFKKITENQKIQFIGNEKCKRRNREIRVFMRV